jgi:hypothetical protein
MAGSSVHNGRPTRIVWEEGLSSAYLSPLFGLELLWFDPWGWAWYMVILAAGLNSGICLHCVVLRCLWVEHWCFSRYLH